jgi:hypothetical protein
MKTVKQVWRIASGDWSLTFDNRNEAIAKLSDTSFLEQFPENTVLVVTPAYQIVDFEVPGYEYAIEPQRLLH